MKRRKRGFPLPFEFGDLERYGMLALVAALVLGVAYLLQAMHGDQPPFRSVGFASETMNSTGAQIPERPTETLAKSRATRRVDAPGGGEFTANAGAIALENPPRSPAKLRPRRRDFDFFEPPVRVAGRPAPLAPPPPGTKEEARTVVVQKGETLQKIAARELGDAAQWRVLVQWNPGIDPKKLKRGQELRLPPPARAAPSRATSSARLHEVAADDTLQSLAERYYGDRARWIDLFEANRDQLREPGDLKAGSRIRIP